MKKWLIPVIIIGVIAFAIYRMGVGFYNTAVDLEQDSKTAWSNVESSYQRRADLIPNLVSTVKGYAAHEKETLEGVIKARAAATQTTIDPTNITPEKMAAFQKAQQGLSGALSRLLVTVEKYPELKANQNFLNLQDELSDTENKIQAARRFYNNNVQDFNTKLQVFPTNIIAKQLNFVARDFFEIEDPKEKKNIKVEF